MKSTGESWMGTPEAAEFLGVTLRTLYRFIDDGDIPAYKFGRVIRVRRRDVEDFIERSRIEPGELRHLYPPEPLSRARAALTFDAKAANATRSSAGRSRQAPASDHRVRPRRRPTRHEDP